MTQTKLTNSPCFCLFFCERGGFFCEREEKNKWKEEEGNDILCWFWTRDLSGSNQGTSGHRLSLDRRTPHAQTMGPASMQATEIRRWNHSNSMPIRGFIFSHWSACLVPYVQVLTEWRSYFVVTQSMLIWAKSFQMRVAAHGHSNFQIHHLASCERSWMLFTYSSARL